MVRFRCEGINKIGQFFNDLLLFYDSVVLGPAPSDAFSCRESKAKANQHCRKKDEQGRLRGDLACG